MKKHFFNIILCLMLVNGLNAQKVWSTRTAQIKFYSKTPVEDIDAVQNEVSSKISTATGQVQFTILIKGFRFENSLMQEHFNEDYMESNKFPKAEFKGVIKNNNTVNYTKNGTYKVDVDGTITIHGVTKALKVPATIIIANNSLEAKSVFKLKLKDFNIKGSAIGKEVAETVEVTIQGKYK